MEYPEFNAWLAHERHRDQLARAVEARLAAAATCTALPPARRFARPIGRALLWLGLWLLRYARDAEPLTAYSHHAPAHPTMLN